MGASGQRRACPQRLAAPQVLAPYPRLPLCLGLARPGTSSRPTPVARQPAAPSLGPLTGVGQGLSLDWWNLERFEDTQECLLLSGLSFPPCQEIGCSE